jgi:3-hydroxyisobutyrate dehydrogenase-like beta-hydroxyacid dehydrogenase
VSVIEMLSEAMALAEKHGLGRGAVLSFVEAFMPAPPIVVGPRDALI